MANKRTTILEAIEAQPGELTQEQLMELAEVNKAGLASQLSYIRISGKFPVKNEEGKFILITEEEWEARKAERASGKDKVELTPEEMLTKLEKKATRAASAQTNAAKKAKDSGDDVDKLKAKKADLELKICELELGRFQAENPDVVSAADAT